MRGFLGHKLPSPLDLEVGFLVACMWCPTEKQGFVWRLSREAGKQLPRGSILVAVAENDSKLDWSHRGQESRREKFITPKMPLLEAPPGRQIVSYLEVTSLLRNERRKKIHWSKILQSKASRSVLLAQQSDKKAARFKFILEVPNLPLYSYSTSDDISL